MSTETQTEPGTEQQDPWRSITDSLDRVWNEIKQISRQVEAETRRSGRLARLRLDIRQLRKEQFEVFSRLGRSLYEARKEHGDELGLDRVPGYEARIAALESLEQKITAKQTAIDALKKRDHESDDLPDAADQPAEV